MSYSRREATDDEIAAILELSKADLLGRPVKLVPGSDGEIANGPAPRGALSKDALFAFFAQYGIYPTGIYLDAGSRYLAFTRPVMVWPEFKV